MFPPSSSPLVLCLCVIPITVMLFLPLSTRPITPRASLYYSLPSFYCPSHCYSQALLLPLMQPLTHISHSHLTYSPHIPPPHSPILVICNPTIAPFHSLCCHLPVTLSVVWCYCMYLTPSHHCPSWLTQVETGNLCPLTLICVVQCIVVWRNG